MWAPCHKFQFIIRVYTQRVMRVRSAGKHSLGCSVNAQIGMTGSTGSHVYKVNSRMVGHIKSHELCDVLYSMFIGFPMFKLHAREVGQGGEPWLRT